MTLENKKIGLIVTGGIAAYKSLGLVRSMVKQGAEVRVVMTNAATKFVTPLSFETLSKNNVLTDLFSEKESEHVAHIEFADWADLTVVAPATANMIAKMANGVADDFASTTLLATEAPKVVVPAMNEHMLMNPAMQRNLRLLEQDGVQVIEPETGFLAEGYSGKGRFPELETIMAVVNANFSDKDKPLKGKNILVTAGGTQERIDPVRFIGNDSSGKMGFAIAIEAQKLGANVTLVSGVSKLPDPVGITTIRVKTAIELSEAITRRFAEQNILIMAAAVSDYRVQNVADQKIKKDEDTLTLTLEKNPDILKQLGKIKQNQYLVGFAAETQNGLINAQEKLEKKNLNLLVLNDVSNAAIGFNSNENEVTLLRPQMENIFIKQTSKKQIARELLNVVISDLKK
ncbi:bifunctional phosphopantothenoylcysteine decarboxylase/phosphopantothenate--cysteine ligase CoaBC [Dellaglioa algida]|uniref:bifunctional phosphopantothenoylcysteine decarboxylase/phosphopantothenate--cysteine ligase CoaBC n=1 Tax=Dellaglioa algida TaxID=105612 RepID=UPI0024C4760C|nr:bifunctional phosphopantothenoylcysteine decarboxylase/phosphopantothenate--cysteine ligase CoaBC [Dellaglioa algida]MDK1727454.1 bifunctional phosphopantothenoylcysteine decarboxylase/phosphopantothenate--cysteine ligase CoaBC [Dellaglioa algida]MDK1735420.1 bifunctional phosphopantothenoylcysteine decarboxylase/phosphopantothenate--cysteine ligase CoaBC [Dellaglioa algida]MDK1736777.1 bifunctional phosphopantothenoylcysteine decarboxylase/phosphopantothenate--cysteine ligase CoaBC [Dellagli